MKKHYRALVVRIGNYGDPYYRLQKKTNWGWSNVSPELSKVELDNTIKELKKIPNFGFVGYFI